MCLLNVRESGKHGLYVLALDSSVDIVLCNLIYKAAESNNTDKVGDHHETVECIGNVPCERRSKYCTEENCNKVDYLVHECGASAEEIFPCL